MAGPVNGEDDRRGHVEEFDRRGFPRVELKRRALLRLSADLTFRGTLQNISNDAAQVLCELRYALLIHPAGDDSTPDSERAVDISVALPGEDGLDDFKARCRLVYCVRYDDRYMALGLQFVETDARSVQRLDRFLQTNSAPDSDQ
jgi:hypothetical protein